MPWTAVVNEYADNMLQELNYSERGLQRHPAAANMPVYRKFTSPTSTCNLSTPQVMTMEFVEGVKITKVQRLTRLGWIVARWPRLFVRAVIKQLLFDGFFHGDPHPGNILVNL